MDTTSRWIIKEIGAIARTATAIAARSHAGESVQVEERLQLQRRKIALLEAINRRTPDQAGAQLALLEAERELHRLRGGGRPRGREAER